MKVATLGLLGVVLTAGILQSQEGLKFRLPEEEKEIIQLKKEAEKRKLELLLKELEYKRKMRELDLKVGEIMRKVNYEKAKTYKDQVIFERYFFAMPPSVKVKAIVGDNVVVENGLVLGKGSRIEGWKIVEVEPSRIVVKLGKVKRQITLTYSVKRPEKLTQVESGDIEIKQIPSEPIRISSEELAKFLRGETVNVEAQEQR